MIKAFLKKNRLTFIGLVIGAVGGFLYWKYVGCTSGTCPITSSPVNSTLWGAVREYADTGQCRIHRREV